MKLSYLIGICAALLGGAMVAMGQEIPQPVVRITFDDQKQPLTVEDGGKLPLAAGGVEGMALKTDGSRAIEWPMDRAKMSWEEGTISFWFQPVDWSGTPRFHHFLHTITPGANRSLNLVVAGIESPTSENLSFRFADLKGRPAHRWNGFSAWKNGQWYFVTGTWDKQRMTLYLNGEVDADGGGTGDISQVLEMNAKVFEGAILRIGTDAGWKKYDTRETTLMDELEIRDQCLNAEQVRQLYYQQKPKGQEELVAPPAAAVKLEDIPRPRLVVPADASAPTIDGNVNDAEWADAAAIAGLNDGDKGVLSDKPFVGFLKSDGRKLYFAFRSKVPAMELLQHDQHERDSQTYLDDSWEFYVYPDARTQTFYQLVVNSEGAIFDWHANDKSWNGHWEIKQRIERPDVWDMEMAIPLEDLGVHGDLDGAQWRVGICVNQKAVQSRSFTWAPLMGLFDQPDRMGVVTFKKQANPVRLLSLGNAMAGLIAPLIEWPGPGRTVAVTVTDAQGKPERKVINAPRQTLDFQPLPGTGRAVVSIVSPADAAPGKAEFQYSTIVEYDSVPLAPRVVNYPSRQEVCIELNYGSMAHAETIKAYRIDLGEGAKVIERKSEIPWERVYLSTINLKPGPRSCSVALLDGQGQARVTKSFEYTREGAEEWLHNTVGIEKGYVPPPYTPMKVKDRTVEVIGRKIELTETGLPRQIVSAGVTLLAGPVTIEGEFDGQKAAVTSSNDFSYTQVQADDSAGAAQVKLGPLSGTIRQTVSFDGLCWYEVDLSAKAKANAKNVAIEIPLTAQAAKYYQVTDTDYKMLGIDEWEISDPLKKDMDLPFTPQVYLGNDHAGLAWMAETEKGWQVVNDHKTIQIIRRGDAVVMRINLVDAPIGLDRLKFEFGLQATPVKPVLPTQQKFIFAPGRFPEFPDDAQVYDVYQGHRAEVPSTFESYAGFPEPANPKLALEEAARQKSQGSNLTPYSVFTWLSLDMPEMQIYGGDWYLNQPWAAVAGMGAHPAPFGLCDIENRNYQDFMVWRFVRNWNAYGGSSIYYDLFSPAQDKLPEHKRAYVTRSGRTDYPWPILATRSVVRRLYIAYKQKDPNFQCFTHASNLYTALVSFGDAWPVGEHFGFSAGRYPQVLPYERYRAWFYGYPLGVKTMFLPSLKTQALVDRKELTNYLVGVVFNHNTTFWVCFINQPILFPYLRTYHGGQWPLQKFLPYWEHPKLTNLDPSRFKVSGWYNQKEKKGLLVVASLSAEPTTAQISIGPDWTDSSSPKLGNAIAEMIPAAEFSQWDAPATFDGRNATFRPYGVLMLSVK